MNMRRNALVLTVGALAIVPLVAAAWTGPSASPPNGNIPAPVNVGTTNQVKNSALGVNGLAVFGNAILNGVGRYFNFGSTAGTSGYGIRDNAGLLEFKNSGGSWESLQTTVFNLVGGTGSWTASGNNIYNANTGNVGIGTASPGAPLHVASASDQKLYLSGSASPRIVFDSTTGDDYWLDLVGGLRVYNSTDSRYEMLFDGTGNVGIGTTPVFRLDISPTADAQLRIGNFGGISGDTSGGFMAGENIYRDRAGAYRALVTSGSLGGGGMIVAGGGINFVNYTGASTLGSTVSPTSRMYIDTSGNVGIGTSNPSAKLDVNGDARISGNLGLKVQYLKCHKGQSCDTSPGSPQQVSVDCPANYIAIGCSPDCQELNGIRECWSEIFLSGMRCSSSCQNMYGAPCNSTAGNAVQAVCMRITDIGD